MLMHIAVLHEILELLFGCKVKSGVKSEFVQLLSYFLKRNVIRVCVMLSLPAAGFHKLAGREFQTDGQTISLPQSLQGVELVKPGSSFS